MHREFLRGFAALLAYFSACAIGALSLRRLADPPSEVFRKTLHLILLGSFFVWTYAFATWWVSAAAALAFIVVVYPALAVAEGIPGYSGLLVERKAGEIKRSLVVVFGMFAVMISACWGLLGQKYIAIACVLAWGLGDAAAALVGKRFGRRFIQGRFVEGRKSVEGSLAMFCVAFVTVLAALIANKAVPWYAYVPVAAFTALACAAAELFTKGGMDTVTAPFAAAAALIPLILAWGA